MALFDVLEGFNFDVPEALPGLGGGPMPTTGLDFSLGPAMSALSTPGGNNNAPGANWFDTLSNAAGKLGPIVSMGTGLAETGLKFYNAAQMKDYQDKLAAYYANRSKMEEAYNAQVIDYLKKKAAYEAEVAGTVMGGVEEFHGLLGEALGQTTGIIEETLEGARPFLEESRDLLEPAIAALAKGEVPPMLAPILDEAKQRARAAALQSLASAGMEDSSAAAAIEPQIDQQATAMLLQFAQGLLTGGVDLGKVGLTGIASAGQIAGGTLGPIASAFGSTLGALNALYGGFPGLAPAAGPGPVPTA